MRTVLTVAISSVPPSACAYVNSTNDVSKSAKFSVAATRRATYIADYCFTESFAIFDPTSSLHFKH